MKLCTDEIQTAKLIELGFEKPRNTQYVQRAKARNLHSPFIEFGEPEFEGSYSIGELISFLPDDGVSNKRLEFDCFHWLVDWDSFDKIHQTMQVELVDALYDMCVKLKEEGVI